MHVLAAIVLSAASKGQIVFSPQDGESAVPLNTPVISVTFAQKIRPGFGNITVSAMGSDALPYEAVRIQMQFSKGLRDALYKTTEKHHHNDGPGVLYNVVNIAQEEGLLQMKPDSFQVRLPTPSLRAETTYVLDFDRTLVIPPQDIPRLSFSTFPFVNGRPEHWTEQCDPWKFRPINPSTDYTSVVGGWSDCSPSRRSVSGCGDFVDDTRQMRCESPVAFPMCSAHPWFGQFKERTVYHDPQTDYEYLNNHVCFNERVYLPPIKETRNRDFGLPSSTMGHREQWSKWGAYEYIPVERWVHNVEHGAVAFLYDPCMAEEGVSKIKELACLMAGDGGGAFRWIMTPYQLNRGQQSPFLIYPFVLALYGKMYATHCFDRDVAMKFISQHYRQAIEDFPLTGNYDYLWSAAQSTCSSTADLLFVGGGHPQTPGFVSSFVAVGALFSLVMFRARRTPHRVTII